MDIDKLTRSIRASNTEAFTALYDALHVDLHHYAWHLTRDSDVMYDIVQEAFTILWDKRNSLDPERSIRGWLFRVVRNIAYKHHRNKPKSSDAPANHHGSIENSGPDQYDAKLLAAHLDRILLQLSDRQREVFQMSRLGYLKHQEIAEILDITPKTVRNHLSSALHHIRDEFERLGIEQ